MSVTILNGPGLGFLGPLFQLVGLLDISIILTQFLYVVALFKASDGTFHITLVEKVHCLLGVGIYLALVDTSKEVGIFSHVLTGTFQLLVGSI